MKCIPELLERTAERCPDQTVFADPQSSYTYREFVSLARRIGTALLPYGKRNAPVAVLFPRGVKNLAAMFGVAYSGRFYTVLDAEMPEERMKTILSTLRPAAILADDDCAGTAAGLGYDGPVLLWSQAERTAEDADRLRCVREEAIDTDPLYALFTSGSTGVPKGAVLSHRNVLSYIEWFTEAFAVDGSTVFGSQTPFYFSMSVSDVYATVAAGATLHIIPKQHFAFPMNLIAYLNERKVSTIYWVPSALSIIANWKVLDYAKAEYLTKILFAGEVMPVRQLNYWIAHYPDAMFANLFGPTETTDICTYYVVDRPFLDGESLPIGKACNNCGVFAIKENGEEIGPGEEGELYARGSFLAMGYYGNPTKTAEAFVQNPLNPFYPETVYKTGDLVRRNERGEYLYVTRKDFQIKHMGYRIELGEIEAAGYAVEDVKVCVAVYDDRADRLILIYQARRKPDAMREELAKRLPAYMMPDEIIRTDNIPYNANGKIDRARLKRDRADL